MTNIAVMYGVGPVNFQHKCLPELIREANADHFRPSTLDVGRAAISRDDRLSHSDVEKLV